jgi:hypothetical protein
MTRARSLPHPGVAVAVALLAAALLAGVLAATPNAKASTDDVIVAQPFHADSANPSVGDTCPRGATDGTLGWLFGAPPTVYVTGTALDHPLPGDTSAACGEDGRFTTVTFTAYAGGARVATGVQKVDNGRRAFPDGFSLRAAQPITLVTVQVCRTTLDPAPITYCGQLRKYSRPVTTG